GCFVLMNTGDELCHSKNGLVSTIAIGLNNKISYAVEGSVFVGGAVVQWLRDEMHLITESKDSEYFANKVSDSGGVYFVPAFTGLGAPYWDMYARGSLFGLSRGTNRSHIIKAALEAIAYQTYDVIKAMESDTGIKIYELLVDGGASANNFLMQFQADILNCKIKRPSVLETTALGAAFLAGLSTGVWESLDEIKQLWQENNCYNPTMSEDKRIELLDGWHRAIKQTIGYNK
ncbi:MAG: glycerol kinase, partial [Oscillospiraceae bacterium]|nr:glycerol kinase [Oscillospiraceae bacterium]